MDFDGLCSILWPPRCPACDALVDRGVSFCAPCAQSVMPLGECCPTCAMPWESKAFCPGCQRSPWPFARAFAALAYGGAVTQAILRFKHGAHRHLARPLAGFLGPLLAAVGEDASNLPSLACPVPLHPRRLRQRGFNQALELLRLALDVLPRTRRPAIRCDAVSRIRNTPAMGHGSSDFRRRTVAGAFSVPTPRIVAGKHVLLLDDVMTTGATFAECARTLIAAGAEKVTVAALARAL